jgi:DNA-binding NarL/FixJ family response regulator
MRSVMVCVRTALAAQAIEKAAAQLGLSDVISTAVSAADALAQVAEMPVEVLLVDTASVRPDTVAFTRRVLERAPEAVVVFFGPEDSAVARGAVAAGARGLIRGGDREDLVASVAKALMLLLRSTPSVPLQRSEPEQAPDPAAAADAPPTPQAAQAPPPQPVPAAVGIGRRLALTERELQVLRGMADGKSNAEIGRDLFVSEDTVKTHARRLFRKLGARDRAHAVAAAFRAGLVR